MNNMKAHVAKCPPPGLIAGQNDKLLFDNKSI